MHFGEVHFFSFLYEEMPIGVQLFPAANVRHLSLNYQQSSLASHPLGLVTTKGMCKYVERKRILSQASLKKGKYILRNFQFEFDLAPLVDKAVLLYALFVLSSTFSGPPRYHSA